MKKPQTADFSIRLPGTLTVKKHAGTYRTFTVGELVTPLAEFKVLDKWVEQLDAGTYEGEFWISRLEPTSRTWRTRLFIEIQARVFDYRLKHAEEVDTGDNTFPERDPIEDEAPAPKPAPARIERTPPGRKPAAPRSRNARQPAAEVDRRHAQLVELFGSELAELIADGTQHIKLDSTIDRQVLRQQIDFLRKELGYEIDLETQHWGPPRK